MNRTPRGRRWILAAVVTLLGGASRGATPAASVGEAGSAAIAIPGVSNPEQLTRVAGRVLLTATGGDGSAEVWRTDGTAGGTERLVGSSPGETFLFLSATSVGVALETADGAIRHARARTGGVDFLFRPEGELSSARSGFRIGGKAHFFVFVGGLTEKRLELWQVDGGPEGNRKLVELASFHPFFAFDLRVAVAPDRRSAYFFPVATDGSVGDIEDGLWRTDGSLSGTRRVVDFPCAPCFDVRVGETVVGPGGKLFYVVNDFGRRFAQLWVSDGTEAGTTKLLEAPGSIEGGEIRSLARLGPRVVFSAFDLEHGQELWVSDGTETGTRRLADLRPGRRSSRPNEITVAGSRALFSADDGSVGRELWATDGTPQGTIRVADLRPGEPPSTPRGLTTIGSRWVFAANDGRRGVEVWVSDGTAAGTRLASDVGPGALPSYPADFVALGSELLFTASRGGAGRELFRLPLSALGPP